MSQKELSVFYAKAHENTNYQQFSFMKNDLESDGKNPVQDQVENNEIIINRQLTYDEILKAVEDEQIDEQTPRTVFYLPFSPSQDTAVGSDKLLNRATAFKQTIGIRALAGKLAGGEPNIKQDDLVSRFNALTEAEQNILLKEAARKIPLIKQHGGLNSDLQVRPIDAVVVYAHGSKSHNVIAGVPNPTADEQWRTAEDLADQMLRDGIPNQVGKIKLYTCGSGGGEFHKALHTECENRGLFQKTDIIGYAGDSHYLFDAERPLDKLGKGRHQVVNKVDEDSVILDGERLMHDLHEVREGIQHDIDTAQAFKDGLVDIDELPEEDPKVAAYAKEIAMLTKMKLGVDAKIESLRQGADFDNAKLKASSAKVHRKTVKEVMDEQKALSQKGHGNKAGMAQANRW